MQDVERARMRRARSRQRFSSYNVYYARFAICANSEKLFKFGCDPVSRHGHDININKEEVTHYSLIELFIERTRRITGVISTFIL